MLQVLFMTPEFREAVEKKELSQTLHVDTELKDLFIGLKTRSPTTHDVIKKLGIENKWEQRDAAEYFERILNLASPQASQTFLGGLTHFTACSQCGHSTDVDGSFWTLNLAINKDSTGDYNVEGATVTPMKDYDPRSTRWDHAIHSSTIQSHQPPPEHNLISTSRKAETQIGHLSDQPVTQHVDRRHFTRDHMGPTPRNVQGGKTDQEGEFRHHLKEPSMARKPLEEGSLADKGRVMVSSSEQGHPDGFKDHRPSQATNKVDIVGQEKREETELPTAKLDESETESLHNFKRRTTDFHSSTVQSHQLGSNLPSSRKYGEMRSIPLSEQLVTREFQGGKTRQCYLLPRGRRVLVRHGDITKEQADALVNAANGDLRHVGGVAAALSHAGGFSVQQESTALVKERGPFATGEAVMTTGGYMQCKKLIHIIGPAQGEANGQERQLLTRSVLSALKLADDNQFRSIAMPCINSGDSKVPISLCAEAIVTAVERFWTQSLHLNTITLIDTRAEVVRALQVACDRVFPSANAELGAAGGGEFQESTGASAPPPLPNYGANPVNRGADVSDNQNIVGYIEKQDVDVIVLPMKNSDPFSTGVGQKLSKIIGHKRLDAAFSKVEKDRQELVEVNVMDLKELSCHKVFFVNLIPWNERNAEAAVQILQRGLHQVLFSCQNQGFASVAFPILGTGNVLKFPQHVAASVLLEGIEIHKRSRHNSIRLKICLVLHPSDKPPGVVKTSPPPQSFAAHSNTAPSDRWADKEHLPASPDERELDSKYCSLM